MNNSPQASNETGSGYCTKEKDFNLWKCNNDQQCQVEGLQIYNDCISKNK